MPLLPVSYSPINGKLQVSAVVAAKLSPKASCRQYSQFCGQPLPLGFNRGYLRQRLNHKPFKPSFLPASSQPFPNPTLAAKKQHPSLSDLGPASRPRLVHLDTMQIASHPRPFPIAQSYPPIRGCRKLQNRIPACTSSPAERPKRASFPNGPAQRDR